MIIAKNSNVIDRIMAVIFDVHDNTRSLRPPPPHSVVELYEPELHVKILHSFDERYLLFLLESSARECTC